MSAPGRAALLAWLAAAAAAVLLVALWLDLSMIPGPWLLVAFFSGASALLASLTTLAMLHAVARHADAAQVRTSVAEAECQLAQREIERLGRVENEITQARQAAESAALAKGEFLATMSHEIRTPLNGILPMLELLSHSTLATDQRQLLQTAATSSQALLRIVDDILDYSKLEANKLELENIPFNLRDVLEQVMQLMQRPAENRGLRLGLQLDPAVRLSVRGDPLRLRQVLTNLIGNAIKFTERGSVTLVAQRLGETAAQHLLRFEVRDTGIGIDLDAQTRLFQPFNQADASTTRLFGGTGLGLAICKRIVDLIGGRIAVVSEPGRGSTFWLEIPLLKALGDLAATKTLSSQARVLLVPPDPLPRSRLSSLMSPWNMSLQCVESTQEALERLRTVAGGFTTVIADLPGVRNSASALHRAVGRAAIAVGTQLVWLYGDEPVPAEQRANASSLPRLAHDADLRALLSLIPPASATVTGAPAATLPLPAPELYAGAATDLSEPSDTQNDAPETNRGEQRVLLVEDNPVNLAVAEKMLESLGLVADHAGNGLIALEKMQNTRYLLVLMDCQMPLLDGYTATRRWREREAERGEPRTPIVAMTANAMAGDRQRCLNAGMDDYLAKPVSRSLLEKCLRQWLPAADAPTSTVPLAVDTASLAPLPQPVADHPRGETPAQPCAPQAWAEMPPDLLPTLDGSVLDELAEVLSSAELSRIIQIFLEDAPQRIKSLEIAAGALDVDAMGAAAHALKSSSANMGAMALSEVAKQIELGARQNRRALPLAAVETLTTEFAKARLALQSYLTASRSADRPIQSSSLVNR